MGRWLDRIKNTNTAPSEPTTSQVSSAFSVPQPSKSHEMTANLMSNDSSVSFVSHRDKLLQHLRRKKSLGHRVEILRILIRRIMVEIRDQKSSDQSTFIVNDSTVEAIVDLELANYEYDLEKAIDSCRCMAPEPVLFCKCGYRHPFCSCDGTPASDVVTCNSCKHFTPDAIGDGAGIGTCALGVESTQELSGKTPLFRYSNRHCDKFNEIKL